MSTVQAWLIIGIPAIVLALTFLLGHTWWRALLGYASLAAGFFGLALVHRLSAAVFAGLIVFVYATGRGGQGDGPARESSQDRTHRHHHEVGASGTGPT